MTNIKVSSQKKSRARGAEKFWTKTRMRKATPIPIKVGSPRMLELGKPQAGQSRIVPPVLPRNVARLLAETNEVSDITQFPFSYVGKLFMREGNRNFVGSAWVIGNQAIFTAAHCLFDDNGTFFDDVVFHPQFRNGSSLGAVAVVQMAIDQRYIADSGGDNDLRFDLGIGILDRPIGHLTGIAGFAVNPTAQIAPGNFVTGMGYPAGPPFDGTKMFKSKGRVVRDSAPGTFEERFFGAENEMTGGCSGGAWVDTSNIAIGLSSFVFVGENPPVMHSPYFGQGFEDLVEWAEDNGGDDGSDDDNGDDDESDAGSVAEKLKSVVETLNDIIGDLD